MSEQKERPLGCNGPHDSFMDENKNSYCACFRCGELRIGPKNVEGYLDRIVELKTDLNAKSQLLKEKEETIQSLQKSLFGRSAHADVMEHKATRVNALLSEKEVEIANLKKALNHAYKQYSLHITTFAGNHIPMVAKLKKECEALAKGDGSGS